MKPKAVYSDQSQYNFIPSGIGNSWLIGNDDIFRLCNAFKNGYSDCPYELIIPSTLTNANGETKPVEVIGYHAFSGCATNNSAHGDVITRKIIITKQVKVIKRRSFGSMDCLEEFVIEKGSVLETVDMHGLDDIGYWAGQNESKRVTLVLPSTLSTVYDEGIYLCNLFNVIIYCGSHLLPNISTLESRQISNQTVVKVSSDYPPGQEIFGRTPDRDSQEEVEEKCRGYVSGFRTEFAESEKDVVIKWWGNKTNKGCPDSLEIPEKVDGYNVVAVKDKAFENCTTSGPISLPSTVKRIGAFAFANTPKVNAIFLNSSKIEIGESAFQGCGKDAQKPIRVSLPRDTELNKSAFAGAKIGEVYIR